jgi:capsular exopolysaccharide synthesis family protein
MEKRFERDSVTEEDRISSLRSGDDPQLRRTLRILWRRKWLIATVVVVITGVVGLFSFTVTPRYEATLQIVFESRTGPAFDLKAAAAGQPQDEPALVSEIDVIQSRNLSERVVEALGLADDPEFNANLRSEGAVLQWIRKWLPWLAPASEAEKLINSGLPQEKLGQIEHELVIDEFIRGISAKQTPRSRTINIAFVSTSVETAADVLNKLAELFLVSRLEDRFANAQRASRWLTSRVQGLRDRVEESEKAAENYRREHGLFEGDRATLITEQISQLSGNLTEATIARRAAEANVAQVSRLLPSAKDVEVASQVLQSTLIQRFREQELALERKEAEMRQKFGPQHPLMIQVEAEKKSLNDSVRLEINKILRDVKNEAQVAREREAALTRDMEALKAEVATSNQAAVGLHALQREAEANRLLLDKFLTAFMETSAQEDVSSQLPDARIISAAPLPKIPYFPKPTLFIAVALLASTVVGVMLAIAVEHVDAGFRSAEEIEHLTGVPVFAHIPRVSEGKPSDGGIASYVLKRPKSAYAEAIRAIHIRLLMAYHGETPKVVLFTSAEPLEGKSSIAVSLARQQVDAGQRVIIVDGDFRRSRIAQCTQLAAKPGLSEVLMGTVTWRDVVQTDTLSAAQVIVAGEQSVNQGALAGSKLFNALLEELRAEYDLIILDSAPVMALADTHIIAAAADVTLMVVRWGKTRRRVVRYAIEQLTKFGGQVDGTILSMVNVKKLASYGYGDSGYYSARYYAG